MSVFLIWITEALMTDGYAVVPTLGSVRSVVTPGLKSRR